MAQKLEVHRVDDALDGMTLYRLNGFFTDCKDSYNLLKEVRAASEARTVRLVMNLSGVSHLTSGGVGILAACYTSVTGSGGTMCLVGVSDRARVVLETVGLAKVLECFDSEAALASPPESPGAPPPT
jgi:anti-anti-sigma factor